MRNKVIYVTNAVVETLDKMSFIFPPPRSRFYKTLFYCIVKFSLMYFTHNTGKSSLFLFCYFVFFFAKFTKYGRRHASLKLDGPYAGSYIFFCGKRKILTLCYRVFDRSRRIIFISGRVFDLLSLKHILHIYRLKIRLFFRMT